MTLSTLAQPQLGNVLSSDTKLLSNRSTSSTFGDLGANLCTLSVGQFGHGQIESTGPSTSINGLSNILGVGTPRKMSRVDTRRGIARVKRVIVRRFRSRTTVEFESAMSGKPTSHDPVAVSDRTVGPLDTLVGDTTYSVAEPTLRFPAWRDERLGRVAVFPKPDVMPVAESLGFSRAGAVGYGTGHSVKLNMLLLLLLMNELENG